MKVLPEHAKYKKFYILLIVSAYFMYLMSIAIKMIYSAQLVEIGPFFGVEKSKLSLGLTFYYVVYAVAQIVVSPFLKKINLKKFLAVTVFLSSISFGLVKFCTELWQIYIILSLNGIFQLGIYGGCMGVFSKYLPDYMSATVTNILSTGMAFGTALAYGFSFVFVEFFTWQDTFVFFAILSFVSIVFFYIVLSRVEKNVPEVSTTLKRAVKTKTYKRANAFILISFLCAAALLSCVSYYGLTNWFPSLLKEVFGVPSQYSILITLLVPFGVFYGPFLSSGLCRKFNNYFVVASIFSLVGLLLSIALVFLYSSNIVIVIIINVLLMFFARGYINLISSYIPLRIRGMFDTGSACMVINAVACVSAAFTPLITAVIADNFGWKYLFIFIFFACLVWFITTLIGTIWADRNKVFNMPQV
ncbi:MAG: MFS transporter [Clostridia bacterium]|nr:MFS transporter [Clostridia bacterium]